VGKGLVYTCEFDYTNSSNDTLQIEPFVYGADLEAAASYTDLAGKVNYATKFSGLPNEMVGGEANARQQPSTTPVRFFLLLSHSGRLFTMMGLIVPPGANNNEDAAKEILLDALKATPDLSNIKIVATAAPLRRPRDQASSSTQSSPWDWLSADRLVEAHARHNARVTEQPGPS